MTATPIVLVDVDGVLSPFGTPEPDAGGWTDWDRHAFIGGFHLAHSPTLFAMIRDLPAELRWVSSWGELANEILVPAFDWPAPVPVAAEMYPIDRFVTSLVDGTHTQVTDADTNDTWPNWKPALVAATITEDRPVIWLDDDWAAPDPKWQNWDGDRPADPYTRLEELATTRGVAFLGIAPERNIGLTVDHLEQIHDFIATHREDPPNG